MSRDIPINLIDPDPNQPRQHFDQAKLAEMAQSMDTNGLAVPILVRPSGDRFIIVHGERRYRAALSLNWAAIRAEVRDVSENEARWLSLVENVQRADLSPIEEARAYQARLAEGITQTELGERIGKSQSYIAQKLRLLTLPDPIMFYLDKGGLTEGHARQLLKLKGMYGDLKVNLDTWRETIGKLDYFNRDANYVFGLLQLGIRPEDNPPCFFLDVHKSDKYDVLAEACRQFDLYVARQDFEVFQWEIASLWWASLAVYLDMSVADFSKSINLWFERFCAAVWRVHSLYNDEKPPQHKFNALYWWGYRSDLYHSNASEFPKKNLYEWPKAIQNGIMKLFRTHSIPLPSSCQSWGENRELYIELLPADDD